MARPWLSPNQTPVLPPQVFEWAVRLARTPGAVSDEDIRTLREAGLSDRAILDAVLTIAYFSYANRLVMGLGLAPEPDFEATCRPDLGGASAAPPGARERG